ncbi:MAG: signal peptidase II [Candidatus Gastranaerophilaceae bacterium]
MARKKQQNLWNKIIYLFLTFAVFICADSYLSDFVVSNITDGYNFPSNPVITLNYVKNTGAAFSILHEYPYLLIALSVVALIFLFVYIIRHAGTMTYVGIFWLSLMMSGIFCNLIERVHLGYVRDYFYLLQFDFPIFNVSDIFINVSVVAIVILLLKRAQLKQL